MNKHLTTIGMAWIFLTIGTTASANEAKKAFEEGTALYRNDQFAEAAEAFRRAHALKPAWKILFNIGQCSAAAKQYGMALEAFEAYLSQGGDDVPYEKRRNVIGEIKILREMVGYLDIRAPDGCSVMIDNHKRGDTPLPGPIPVGSGVNHRLEIMQSELDVLKKTIRVNSGQTIVISALEKEPADETPATEDHPGEDEPSAGEDVSHEVEGDARSKSMTPLRIAGVVTAGVGLGTLGGALYTGLKTMTLSDKLDKKTCVGTSCDDETDEMDKFQLITNVLLGVGGTLVVAGATMLIFSFVAGSKSDSEPEDEEVGVYPIIGPQSASLSLTYSF